MQGVELRDALVCEGWEGGGDLWVGGALVGAGGGGGVWWARRDGELALYESPKLR